MSMRWPQMPETLALVGQAFGVSRVPSDDSDLRRDGHTAVGSTRLVKQRLFVSDNLAPDQERDTLLHEVLHALIGIVRPSFSDRVEEEFVQLLTPLLLDALRRNPGFVAYLVG